MHETNTLHLLANASPRAGINYGIDSLDEMETPSIMERVEFHIIIGTAIPHS
jgi:hypothetical protein